MCSNFGCNHGVVYMISFRKLTIFEIRHREVRSLTFEQLKFRSRSTRMVGTHWDQNNSRFMGAYDSERYISVIVTAHMWHRANPHSIGLSTYPRANATCDITSRSASIWQCIDIASRELISSRIAKCIPTGTSPSLTPRQPFSHNVLGTCSPTPTAL